MAKMCGKCRWKYEQSCIGLVMCSGYEQCYTDEEEQERAESCSKYEEGDSYYDPDEEEHYTPSATHGDYSPSCPWNAPGMSIRDFI